MIYRLKKLTSLLVVAAMMITCFASINVFADEPITMGVSINLPSSVEKNGVNLGNPFKATVSLDFDEDFIYAAGGLIVVKLGITFDPNILEPVDPSTNEVIEFDEAGKPVSGSLYTYGDIASNPTRMNMQLRTSGRTIEAYYTASPSSDADNIWTSGNFFDIAFRPKKDVSVENSGITTIGFSDIYVGGLNKVDIEATGESASVTYKPPYTFNIIDQTLRVGEYLSITGTKYIRPEDNEYPLMIYVTKYGTDVEEPLEVSADQVIYTQDYLIDEAKYSAGSYVATASHNNSKIVRTFEVVENITTPVPDDGDEKEEDNSGDTDGTINVTPNTGNTNPGTNNNTSTDTNKEDKNTETPTDTKDKTDEVYKPQVKYPSDTAGHWADSNIKYVYENSLMNGYADGTFGPDNSITRAEFVTVMARLLGKAEDPVAAGKFQDAYDHWAKGYIGALTADGIIGGVSENEFAPDENVTREQIAVILARAFGLTAAEVADLYAEYADDALISDWARDGVYSVTAAGYMQGSDNNFNPTASATRAEVATIIYRLHSK